MATRRPSAAVFALFVLFLWSAPAHAWLFHEHTHIGRTAVQQFGHPVTMDQEGQAAINGIEAESLTRLQLAWTLVMLAEQEARLGLPKDGHRRARLCKDFARPESAFLFQTSDAEQRDDCIDFPMLAALAADFSCSPEDLWNLALGATWVPDILDQAEKTETALHAPGAALADRLDAWHDDNVQNFVKDADYLTRAGDNRSHFAWSRQTDVLKTYLEDALSADNRKPNSYAFYVLYHAAALRLAQRAELPKGASAHWEWARKAILAEAFALHFLEDSFSAGHLAGRRGGDRMRNGTHDYYCEHGVGGQVWQEGREDLCTKPLPGCAQNEYYAHGDAFMATTDRLHAGLAVQRSLHDLSHAFWWDISDRAWLFAKSLDYIESTDGARMNACQGLATVPPGLAGAADDGDIRYTLRVVIQPVRATDGVGLEDGERTTMLPAFSTEMGVFVGVFASARMVGGFDVQGTTQRWQALGKMDAGAEVGLNLAGVTTAETDGLLWFQAGMAIDSPGVYGPNPEAHPGRFGLALRLRAPFYAVPLLEHVVYTLPMWFGDGRRARSFLTKGAVDGTFGLARVHTGSKGSMQLVLGREFGFRCLLGPNGENNTLGFDWPIAEYKPPPWYAGTVGNVFTVQVGASLDVENSQAGILGLFLRLGTSTRWYRYP